MKIGFFSYQKFHGKESIGSTRIRVNNLIDVWNNIYPDDEVEVFKHGKKYDVVVFQKVYFDTYAEGLDCIKVLDLCDPDWLSSWVDIIRMIEAVDIVVVSSEGLYDYLKKIVKKPLYYLRDRHKVSEIPFKEKHEGNAKNVLWYGYAHNAHCLRPVVKYIKEYNLKLTAFCQSLDTLNSFFSKNIGTKVEFTEGGKNFNFVKFNPEVQDELFLKQDFCVLPPNIKPEGYFKSNNKTTLAQCYGLPVAQNIDDFKRFIDPKERNKEFKKCEEVRKEYDVRESVKELKEILLSFSGSAGGNPPHHSSPEFNAEPK